MQGFGSLSDAHRNLLVRLGVEMGSAAHTLLQDSAQAYAETLESYQVGALRVKGWL